METENGCQDQSQISANPYTCDHQGGEGQEQGDRPQAGGDGGAEMQADRCRFDHIVGGQDSGGRGGEVQGECVEVAQDDGHHEYAGGGGEV